MYAELNTKSDYCQKCGYSGEILIDDNLEWYCPNCGNRDHNTLNVADVLVVILELISGIKVEQKKLKKEYYISIIRWQKEYEI